MSDPHNSAEVKTIRDVTGDIIEGREAGSQHQRKPYSGSQNNRRRSEGSSVAHRPPASPQRPSDPIPPSQDHDSRPVFVDKRRRPETRVGKLDTADVATFRG